MELLQCEFSVNSKSFAKFIWNDGKIEFFWGGASFGKCPKLPQMSETAYRFRRIVLITCCNRNKIKEKEMEKKT